jgi:hypothetical protein
LTFLYGPNSAGKSCISDALELIQAVIGGKLSEANLDAMVYRWAHQTGPDKKQSELMGLELQCQVDDTFIGRWSSTASFESQESIDSLTQLLEKHDRRITISLRHEANYAWLIIIGFGPEKIINLTMNEPSRCVDDTLNISKLAFDSMLTMLAARYELVLNEDQHDYEISCERSSDRLEFRNVRKYEKSNEEEKIDSLDREILNFINVFFNDLSQLKILPLRVNPDRDIIKGNQLNYICSATNEKYFLSQNLKIPGSFTNAPSIEFNSTDAAIRIQTDPFESLAQSAFRKTYKAKDIDRSPDFQKKLAIFSEIATRILGEDLRDSRQKTTESESLIDFVNRCLLDHLFIDQGYQIIFDALEIRPAAGIEMWPMSAALMAGFLTDKGGRKLMLQDVGSGISYVVPVLHALHGGYSFIQQPELHLHPALQSSLADVFIESVETRNANHFIETHSEYILLRCLRRIRETTAGKHSVDKSLALAPEDVSVLYFEPQPEGYTRVKSIRISKQGDFMDRWPRGFFEERGKELFDE